MSPFSRILLGIVVMIVGFFIVKKTGKFYEWFGAVPFAENTFGPGGTRFFYKLLGVLTVFIGVFIATNIMSDILGSFSSLFDRS